MSNIHQANKDTYHCPDKGNRFPLGVQGGTKKRPNCPGCGAAVKFFLARDAASVSTLGAEESETPGSGAGE